MAVVIPFNDNLISYFDTINFASRPCVSGPKIMSPEGEGGSRPRWYYALSGGVI